jgi:hypothetical protein
MPDPPGGEGAAGDRPRAHTLRQAASVVFALTAVLPLLIFAYTLYALDAMGKLQAQVSLALALVIALFGFHIFRVMVGRMADVMRAVGTVGREDLAAVARDGHLEVPGIGTIQEFGDIVGTFEHLRTVWKAEAEPHVGQRVLVSVRNAVHPIAGVLTQVTEDGILLDDAGQQVGYRRISAIEVDRA